MVSPCTVTPNAWSGIAVPDAGGGFAVHLHLVQHELRDETAVLLLRLAQQPHRTVVHLQPTKRATYGSTWRPCLHQTTLNLSLSTAEADPEFDRRNEIRTREQRLLATELRGPAPEFRGLPLRSTQGLSQVPGSVPQGHRGLVGDPAPGLQVPR